MALPDCSLPVAWTAFPPQAPCLAHTTDAAPCDLVQNADRDERGSDKNNRKAKGLLSKINKIFSAENWSLHSVN